MSHDLSLAQKAAWHLARTLMTPVVLFQVDDEFGVLPADELDDADVEILFEYDPIAAAGRFTELTFLPIEFRRRAAPPSFLERPLAAPSRPGPGGARQSAQRLRRPSLRFGPPGALPAFLLRPDGPRDGAAIGAAPRTGGS